MSARSTSAPSGVYPPPYARARRDNNGDDGGSIAAGRTMAGVGIEIQPEHQRALDETNKNELGCVNDYRRRISKVISWLEIEYHEYYDEVVIELTPQQRANKDLYHTSTHDLLYNKLNPEFTKLFISANKMKTGDKQYTFDHMRKYHDAILWGAKKANQEFSNGCEYYIKMKTYLDTMKKEKTKAKGAGKMDEQEADPINIELYEKLCVWAIEEGSIMVWVFTIMQWNCMGRCVNVAPLGFRNLKNNEAPDSIVIEYDDNKNDKTGENISPKNCYANPLKPDICMFLALGCYLCVNRDMFDRADDKIFRKNGSDKSSTDTYCKALKKVIHAKESRLQTIYQFVREGHFHPHGTRKGSVTHVATGTTEPPSLPSMLLRGEWTLGKVQELYIKQSHIGDCYVGRCLAGLDPDDVDFGILPPHFTAGMENEYIQEAMALCFGPIINTWGHCGIGNMLLLLLASMVYHSEFLLGYMAPGHNFTAIPILHRDELLQELKKLVTLEPAGSVTRSTGVPTRVKQNKIIKESLETIHNAVEEQTVAIREIPQMVRESVEALAQNAGHVTPARILQVLEEHTAAVSTIVKQTVKDAVEEATRNLAPATRHVVQDESRRLGVSGISLGRFREYDGRAVPSDFALPSVDLRTAWDFYLRGFPSNRSTSSGPPTIAPVRPLRYITASNSASLLPCKNCNGKPVRKKYVDDWKPVLLLMFNDTKHLIINTREEDMNADFLETTYVTARDKLEERYPTLFAGDNRDKTRQMRISTWCKKIKKLNKERRQGI